MVVRASIIWLGLAGGYLFLAGAVSEVETIAGIVFASLGTALALGMSWNADRRFAGPILIRAVTRPFAALLPETLVVGRELVAALARPGGQRGAFVRQPFDPGGSEDPAAAGRRALVIIGLSLAPRTFVVRDGSSDTLLLHALPANAASMDRRWPA